MIPARYGSKRVKQKNLRLINNKPLIHYVIDAAKGSELLTDVYVNNEPYATDYFDIKTKP